MRRPKLRVLLGVLLAVGAFVGLVAWPPIHPDVVAFGCVTKGLLPRQPATPAPAAVVCALVVGVGPVLRIAEDGVGLALDVVEGRRNHAAYHRAAHAALRLPLMSQPAARRALPVDVCMFARADWAPHRLPRRLRTPTVPHLVALH